MRLSHGSLFLPQTLATEGVDTEYSKRDDGLPHSLEHLIFLGSETYPYKGVLDQLANRCLAEVRERLVVPFPLPFSRWLTLFLSQGTNAWTDVRSRVVLLALRVRVVV